uniref:Uncharacterized protein n=1 Tax=Anguilla anguilla TaxID=7936 RepID=A0A0E9TVB4_ANGAN
MEEQMCHFATLGTNK